MSSDIFDFDDFLTEHVTPGVPVPIVKYDCVHPSDWEPVSVIDPNWQDGPWIAGGAPLRWYQGVPVGESDIDVFCKDQKQFDELVERILGYKRYHKKWDSENAVTYEIYPSSDSKEEFTLNGWTIQIIKRKFFDSAQEVIDNFDVSVCQVATDGWNWALGRHTARDIREGNLRMNLPLQADALKRYVKYTAYGYRPVDGLFEAIQNNPVGRWVFGRTEDYENAF